MPPVNSCASDDGSNFTITEVNVVYDQWLNSQIKIALKFGYNGHGYASANQS